MKYFYSVVAAAGFLMCFFGHYFFETTLAMFGTLIGGVSMSILLTIFTNTAFEGIIKVTLFYSYIVHSSPPYIEY